MHSYSILTASQNELYCDINEEDPPDLLEKGWRMIKGEPMGDRYPDEVRLRMDSRYPGIVVPDLIRNTLQFMLVSERLGDLLMEASGATMERLPFHIVNHKGRTEPVTYYILNILDKLDCVDTVRSEYRESKLRPGMIKRLFKLYLDHDRIDQEARLFRLVQMPAVVVIRDDLRQVLVEAEMTGLGAIEEGEKCFIN